MSFKRFKDIFKVSSLFPKGLPTLVNKLKVGEVTEEGEPAPETKPEEPKLDESTQRSVLHAIHNSIPTQATKHACLLMVIIETHVTGLKIFQ